MTAIHYKILDVNLYNNKVFGFISANESKDLGAREVKNNVDGIISYKKHESITVSRIEIIDYENISTERLKGYFNYCSRLTSLFSTNS